MQHLNMTLHTLCTVSLTGIVWCDNKNKLRSCKYTASLMFFECCCMATFGSDMLI